MAIRQASQKTPLTAKYLKSKNIFFFPYFGMAIAKSSTDASQKKEKRMYGDNLTELLKYCAENENFCLLCCRTRTDVVVRHNCCQECDMV